MLSVPACNLGIVTSCFLRGGGGQTSPVLCLREVCFKIFTEIKELKTFLKTFFVFCLLRKLCLTNFDNKSAS